MDAHAPTRHARRPNSHYTTYSSGRLHGEVSQGLLVIGPWDVLSSPVPTVLTHAAPLQLFNRLPQLIHKGSIVLVWGPLRILTLQTGRGK